MQERVEFAEERSQAIRVHVVEAAADQQRAGLEVHHSINEQRLLVAQLEQPSAERRADNIEPPSVPVGRILVEIAKVDEQRACLEFLLVVVVHELRQVEHGSSRTDDFAVPLEIALDSLHFAQSLARSQGVLVVHVEDDAEREQAADHGLGATDLVVEPVALREALVNAGILLQVDNADHRQGDHEREDRQPDARPARHLYEA